MAYGSIKVDNIIYTKGGADTTITVSGIVDSLSGAISVTGSISGASVSAATGTFTTLSGNTTAGTTATFVTGVFTTTLSGATITGDAGQFSNITGVSGVFTTRISGATITGNTGQFTSITGGSGVFTSFSGTTVTATTGVFASGTAAAPSISVGTTNNGLYSSAANEVAVSTSGNSRLVVDASGNVNIDAGTFYVDAVNNYVGVGTTGPGTKVHALGGNVWSSNFYEVGRFQKASGTGVSIGYDNSAYVAAIGAYSHDGTASSLSFWTYPGSGSATERLRLDASGNLGLGVTPSSQYSTVKALQIGALGGCIITANTVANGTTTIGQNWYIDSVDATFRYAAATSQKAMRYSQYDGQHQWFTAGNGTAGNAITFTQAMTLDASGNLAVGGSPNKRLSLIADDSSNSVSGLAGLQIVNTNAGAAGRLTSVTFGGRSATNYPFAAIAGELVADSSQEQSGDLIFFTKNTTTAVNPTERLRITSGGLIGIGTAAPTNTAGFQQQLQLTGNLPCVSIDNTGTGARKYSLGVNGSGALTVWDNTDSVYRMYIDSSGRLLVGTTNVPTILGVTADDVFYKASGTQLTVNQSGSLANGDLSGFVSESGGRNATLAVYKHSGITNPCAYVNYMRQDGENSFVWTDDSGVLRISSTVTNIGTTGGTVVGSQTSDQRIKNILGPVEYGLDTIKQIQPVRFALKSDPETEKLGFIAQQVQPLIPQSVFDTNEHIEGEPEDSPTKLGMEYVSLIPVLVNAIKELSAKNDILEAKVAVLEAA